MEQEQIIYGIHAIEELLQNRISSIDHIYFDQNKKSTALFNLMKICRKERLSYNLIPEIRLNHLAGTDKHQGVVAQCSAKPYSTIEDIQTKISGLNRSPLFLIPASVEDPGNLGAIIRSCAAFSVDALLLERKNTAPLNASVAKSAAGMLEHVTISRPKNLEQIVENFKTEGFAIIGAEMEGGKAPDKIDFTKPCIIILGGENRGIPPYLKKQCTEYVSIPIAQQVQSLNVSAATAVLLYECNRQRNNIIGS
jgi:23S rRNA (guanosine2251-2'-O)-methyltransferase